MNKPSEVPITLGFSKTGTIGHARIDLKGQLLKDIDWRTVTFEVGCVINKDGSTELMEISLVQRPPN